MRRLALFGVILVASLCMHAKTSPPPFVALAESDTPPPPSPVDAPDDWLLAFVDVETTGLVPGWHEMIDAGIVMTDLDGRIVDQLFIRIQPSHPERTSPGARAVNAFDADRWRDLEAVSPRNAVDRWIGFHREAAGDRHVMLVAFNSQFDTAFIDHLFREAGRSWRELYHYFVLDVPSMAWSLGFRDLTGSALSVRLGVPDEPRVAEDHTGLTGALLNARIYRALYKRQSMNEKIDTILASSSHEIGVAFYDTEDGMMLTRNEHISMHAASTMKVPVMLGIFDAAARGELLLDQPIEVRNEFRSIVDGSTFSLDATEDGDPDLYEAVGSTKTIRELTTRMITRSSNLGTNIVIELVGAPRVMELMKLIGADRIQVLRGVEDIKAYRAGLSNTTTALDLMLVFKALLEHRGMSPEASREMIEILSAQEYNESIPAGLPEGTRVAHKTGFITAIHHDAGIVFPPGRRPYILVLLTRGFDDSEEAYRTMAEISRVIWEEVTESSTTP